MRDALLIFGSMSLATKDTAVYSADTLDLNLPAKQFTGRENNVCVVFQPSADFAEVDGMIPFIQDSANGADFTTILTGAEVTAPTEKSQIVLPIPVSHKRYLRAGATPKSSGTFTAVAATAWIELGK